MVLDPSPPPLSISPQSRDFTASNRPFSASYVLSTAKYVKRDLYTLKRGLHERPTDKISHIVHFRCQPLPLSCLARTGHRQVCQNRTYTNQKKTHWVHKSKETYKRDLQKRHTKETYKRDLLSIVQVAHLHCQPLPLSCLVRGQVLEGVSRSLV